MHCTLCTQPADPFATELILGRHSVQYWHCPSCGSVGTEEPFWLTEAYDRAITSSDVGLVARNLEMARMTSVILNYCFDSSRRCLDYGGGYGLFVRLMRDRGYDFYWKDEYCTNLLAAGWEAPPEGEFELLTTFEVLEHLPQPIATLEKLLQLAPNILFSTDLIATPPPSIQDWDYYGLEHGQHVVFYTYQALQQLAQRFDRHFYSDGRSLHLFSQKSLNGFQQQIFRQRRWSKRLDVLSRRPSLLPADARRAMAIATEQRRES
jgi:hypothetical protein